MTERVYNEAGLLPFSDRDHGMPRNTKRPPRGPDHVYIQIGMCLAYQDKLSLLVYRPVFCLIRNFPEIATSFSRNISDQTIPIGFGIDCSENHIPVGVKNLKIHLCDQAGMTDFEFIVNPITIW